MKTIGRKWLARTAFFLAFTCVVAPSAIILGMFTYPIGYEWYGKFLSAMGLIRLPDGSMNNYTCLLFNGALVLAGLGSASYFLARGWEGMAGSRRISWPVHGLLMALSGLVGGLGLVMIGLVPFDISPFWHNLGTFVAVAGFVPALLLCAVSPSSIFASRQANLSWGAFMVFACIISGAMDGLRREELISGWTSGVCRQKLMVLYFCFFMAFHTALLVWHLRRGNSIVPESIPPSGTD